MDCQWETWNPWSSCTDSCAAKDGSGNQERTRASTANTPANNGVACNAADGSGTQSCTEECPGNPFYKLKDINSVTEMSIHSGLPVGDVDFMVKLHRLVCCRGWVW